MLQYSQKLVVMDRNTKFIYEIDFLRSNPKILKQLFDEIEMRKNKIVLFSLIYFITLLLFLPSGHSLKTSSTSSALATKDCYVDSGSPTSNFGDLDWLYFGYRYYFLAFTEAYIGFDTSSPPTNWTKAEVEIDMYSISETTQLTISVITGNWGELDITWVDKPAHGQEITKLTVFNEQIYAIDVTNFISGSSLSICINATALPAGYVQATSREGHSGYIFYGSKLIWTYPTTEGPTIPGYNLLILLCSVSLISATIIKKQIKKMYEKIPS